MTPRSINTHRYMISKCSLKRSPFPASETHLAAASLSTGTVKRFIWDAGVVSDRLLTGRLDRVPCAANQVTYLSSAVVIVSLKWCRLGILWDFLWRFPLLSLNTGACRRTIRLIMFLVISNDLVCSGRRVELNYSRDHPVTSHSSQYWVSDGFNSAVAFILTAPEHVESHLSDSEKCSPPE